MSYEVLVDELRTAAGEYAGVADRVGDPVSVTHVEPASLGHVELAAWLTAVVDQCEKATAALAAGAAGLADSLESTATRYETTDEAVAQRFTQPFGPAPFGAPFGGPFGSPSASSGGGSR
jgi:hypothetical protein